MLNIEMLTFNHEIHTCTSMQAQVSPCRVQDDNWSLESLTPERKTCQVCAGGGLPSFTKILFDNDPYAQGICPPVFEDPFIRSVRIFQI